MAAVRSEKTIWKKLHHGTLQEVQVICRHAVGDCDKSAHERGNKHGTDDDGRAVHIESHAGNQDGRNQNDKVGACDSRVRLYPVTKFISRRAVYPYIEKLFPVKHKHHPLYR